MVAAITTLIGSHGLTGEPAATAAVSEPVVFVAVSI